MRAGRRTGFTLLETVVAVALVAIVLFKVAMILDAAASISRAESAAMTLEAQARRVLDQIAYAVVGCDRDTLFPDPQSPTHTNEVSYQVSLGVEDGEVVWSDPESIGLSEDGSQVVWRQRPGAENEMRVAWSNVVRPFLQGEIQNGTDDNENGLVDERGLSFSLHGDAVVIRLSLERRQPDGTRYTESVETTVTVRN